MLENCEKIRPLISEYIDGQLSDTKADLVRRHLELCHDCSELANSFESNKSALKALPARHTSREFDARLALQIAELRKQHKVTWWERLLVLAPPNRVLRPVLAVTVSAIIVGSYVTNHNTSVVTPTNTKIGAVSKTTDSALIAHCVEQHQNYVETQPLSDWSAQNLDGQADAGSSSGTNANEL